MAYSRMRGGVTCLYSSYESAREQSHRVEGGATEGSRSRGAAFDAQGPTGHSDTTKAARREPKRADGISKTDSKDDEKRVSRVSDPTPTLL